MAFNPQGLSVQPIVSLTPFLGNRWWIKARVIDKSDVRTWNKPNSQGKLFSCTLVDETSAIKATFFNDAVDMFFGMLVPGQVFYVSGGSIRLANRRFSNVNNEYEVNFDKDAQIHLARGEVNSNIPVQRYNFVPISLLARRDNNSKVDILGVITAIGDLGKVLQKSTGQELVKRTVTVADTTAAIDVTLWSQEAESWAIPVGTVAAVKNAGVRQFNGTALSTTLQTTIDTNPSIPETRKLQQWYANTDARDVGTLSNVMQRGEFEANETRRVFFDDITREGLGRGEKPDYIEVRCMPTYINTENIWYDACPKCNKKVQPSPGQQTCRCEKCDMNVMPEPRYLCTIHASDNVTQVWLTMFNECAHQFFGCSAKELKAKHEDDPTFLAHEAQRRLYVPMVCRIRVKEERFGESSEERLKLSAVKIGEVSFDFARSTTNCVRECNTMLEMIASYHP